MKLISLVSGLSLILSLSHTKLLVEDYNNYKDKYMIIEAHLARLSSSL